MNIACQTRFGAQITVALGLCCVCSAASAQSYPGVDRGIYEQAPGGLPPLSYRSPYARAPYGDATPPYPSQVPDALEPYPAPRPRPVQPFIAPSPPQPADRFQLPPRPQTQETQPRCYTTIPGLSCSRDKDDDR